MHILRRLTSRFAAALAILALACAGAAAATPVRVTGGQIEGVEEGGITIYRGIPFAAPPVGALRWQPPQPVVPWQGVRIASAFGPACMQNPGGLAGQGPVSEDCLTLNVWTPAKTSSETLPVMVWIYGGGFSAGATRTPTYAGANLARQGVVVVSVNYRVGRFGFFAHPAITAEGRRVANYSIMDQIAGLEWVRDNVATFGGDPNNVTIFGESAGGVSVNALMATPAARGLFHKAISQSGFGRSCGITLDAAEAQGVAFARGNMIDGTGPAAAAALRALPASDVMGGSGGRGAGAAASGAPQPPEGCTQPGGAPGGLPYPIVDGTLFSQQITTTFEAGRQAPVPYMAGGNSYEASLFAQVRNAPQAAFDRTGDGARAASLYVTGGRDAGLGALDMTTDLQVTEPNRYLARLVARSGQPAYTYYFSFVSAAQRGAAPGAAHGAELPYVFGTLPPTAADDAQRLSRAMSAYWVAFAKTGHPGSAGGVAWTPVATDGYAFMEFAVEGPVLRRDFLRSKLDFLASLSVQP